MPRFSLWIGQMCLPLYWLPPVCVLQPCVFSLFTLSILKVGGSLLEIQLSDMEMWFVSMYTESGVFLCWFLIIYYYLYHYHYYLYKELFTVSTLIASFLRLITSQAVSRKENFHSKCY